MSSPTNPNSPRRPRILILSQNCFTQCDVPLLPALSKKFELNWKVFFPRDDDFSYSIAEIEAFGFTSGVPTEVIRLTHRMRSPRVLLQYIGLLRRGRNTKPDLVYINAKGYPWLGPLVRVIFGKVKVLWAIHDAEEHGTNSISKMFSIYLTYLLKTFKHFHALSQNQGVLIKARAPESKVFIAPHPPLEYGTTAAQPPQEVLRFLFFGNIVAYKGLDLLIDAAQIIHERGVTGFEIVIAGNTSDWSSYAAAIKVPELFKTQIEFLPSDQVPDLFGSAHWLVLPYRHLTQSGPMALAQHYKCPTITSDLAAFGEFVVPGVTGLVFRKDDVEDLAKILSVAVAMGHKGWANYQAGMRDFSETQFSMPACAAKYQLMFEQVLALPALTGKPQ